MKKLVVVDLAKNWKLRNRKLLRYCISKKAQKLMHSKSFLRFVRSQMLLTIFQLTCRTWGKRRKQETTFWASLSKKSLTLRWPCLMAINFIRRSFVPFGWRVNVFLFLNLLFSDSTEKVLRLMGLGQFIPPQLAILPQILHILDPSQVFASYIR